MPVVDLICADCRERVRVPTGTRPEACPVCGCVWRPLTAAPGASRPAPGGPAYTRVTMPYGKYKGLTLAAIAERDFGYLDWLIGTDIRSPQLREAAHAIVAARLGRTR